MTACACVFQETPVRVWGLTCRERLEKALGKIGVRQWIPDPDRADACETVILLRGDHVFDDRILAGLAQKVGCILLRGDIPVAAHVKSGDARTVHDFMTGRCERDRLPPLSFETPHTIASSYQRKLRKIDEPYLYPVDSASVFSVEEGLYYRSYKGVTDLVTKWLWPVPAFWVTRMCVRLGIRPNHVTSFGFILVILAGFLFYQGEWMGGLAAAWLMTFLDTVDGKLARVTLRSSEFGHIYDHAIDLVSPPIWYLLWGFGLGRWDPWIPVSLTAVYWMIFTGYIAGRLCEGIFKSCLEPSGIFGWRPIDSFFRLITARRNPNLILLTTGTLFGRPDLGLLCVALWTVITSLFLVVRLLGGFWERRRKGPLRSWFLDVDPGDPHPSLAQRWFTGVKR